MNASHSPLALLASSLLVAKAPSSKLYVILAGSVWRRGIHRFLWLNTASSCAYGSETSGSLGRLSSFSSSFAPAPRLLKRLARSRRMASCSSETITSPNCTSAILSSMSMRLSSSSSLSSSRIISPPASKSSSMVCCTLLRRRFALSASAASVATGTTAAASTASGLRVESSSAPTITRPASPALVTTWEASLPVCRSVCMAVYAAIPLVFETPEASADLRLLPSASASSFFASARSSVSHRSGSVMGSPLLVSYILTDPSSSRVITHTCRFSSSFEPSSRPTHTYASRPRPRSKLHMSSAWSSMSPLRISMKKGGACHTSLLFSFLKVSSSSDHVMHRTIRATLMAESISDGGMTGVRYSQKKCSHPSWSVAQIIALSWSWSRSDSSGLPSCSFIADSIACRTAGASPPMKVLARCSYSLESVVLALLVGCSRWMSSGRSLMK
mmetsp:Transcript_47213/g.116846  ORF Transcript_47213/g.116846 Transcript_47213/m.116846 type:complete len:444 (-) Transcript_47213:2346-3677(-)